MQVCSAIGAFVFAGLLLWSESPFCAEGETPTISAEDTDSTVKATWGPPCIESGACRFVRTTKVPGCPGMEIVETRTTGECCLPPTYECERRSYWLRTAERTQPLLLTEDCAQQMGADTLGVATMRTTKCDLVINYTELFEDDGCQVRTVGIHLDALGLFGETEGTGKQRKDRCQAGKTKPIRYPRGKGISGSPLVRLDGPTVEEEREHVRLTQKAARTSANLTPDKNKKNNVASPDAAQPDWNAKGRTR
jgi:hypothetical protein